MIFCVMTLHEFPSRTKRHFKCSDKRVVNTSVTVSMIFLKKRYDHFVQSLQVCEENFKIKLVSSFLSVGLSQMFTMLKQNWYRLQTLCLLLLKFAWWIITCVEIILTKNKASFKSKNSLSFLENSIASCIYVIEHFSGIIKQTNLILRLYAMSEWSLGTKLCLYECMSLSYCSLYKNGTRGNYCSKFYHLNSLQYW